MKDQDQQLLWEAYVSEKSKSVAGRTPPKDKLNKGDFLPKKVRDEINDEEDDDTVEETTHSDENSCKDGEYFCQKDKVCKPKDDVHEEGEMGVANAASEGMGLDLARFSAEGRKDPASMIFDAVIAWMENDSSGLVTPEDQDGYSVGVAFDDAKDFVKGELADISLSAVKERMNMDARHAEVPVRPVTGARPPAGL
jgi:hypothetical protein